MTKQDGVTLWRRIQEQKNEDEIDELAAESDGEVDRYILEHGGDSAAIRASGAAFVKGLIERRERLGWHGKVDKQLSSIRETAASMKTKEKLPRAELLQRLTAARSDPRFSVPVAALFYDKTMDASTDDELQAMLDQIELLAKLESGEGGGGENGA